MTSLISANYTANSLWADLGGAYAQKTFDRKMQALTDPIGYAGDRKTEMDRIKASSEAAFKASYKGYQDAGLSPEAAREAAYKAAKSDYASQMEVFDLMFAAGSENVYQARAGRTSSAVASIMGKARASKKK